MNIPGFCSALGNRYWLWGTLGAAPRNYDHYAEVIETVRPMSSAANLALLDCAVAHLDPGECYLEVGTWRGGTLIGAMRDNPNAHGYAIDNEAMTEHNHDDRASRDVWAENVARFGVADRVTYIDGTTPEVWGRLDIPPVGVFLFDGDKASDIAAWDGIAGVVPHLASQALIILDDANSVAVRYAAWRFCREHAGRAFVVLDIPTPCNGYHSFWNGVLVIGWMS